MERRAEGKDVRVVEEKETCGINERQVWKEGKWKWTVGRVFDHFVWADGRPSERKARQCSSKYRQ